MYTMALKHYLYILMYVHSKDIKQTVDMQVRQHV